MCRGKIILCGSVLIIDHRKSEIGKKNNRKESVISVCSSIDWSFNVTQDILLSSVLCVRVSRSFIKKKHSVDRTSLDRLWCHDCLFCKMQQKMHKNNSYWRKAWQGLYKFDIKERERRKGSRKEKIFVRSLMVVLTRKEREGEN